MVRLRNGNGVKRSREELRTVRPLRGNLLVYVYRGALAAYMHPTETREDPLVMESPALTRMNETSFIVVGREVEHCRGEVHRYEVSSLQSMPLPP